MAKYIILNWQVIYITLPTIILSFLWLFKRVCRGGTDMSKRKLDDRGWWVRMRNSLHIATYRYEYISFWG